MKKITKSEAFKLLKDKKIYIGNDNTVSVKFADFLEYFNVSKIARHDIYNYPYIEFNSDLSYIVYDHTQRFIESKKNEISIHEIVSLEIIEDKSRFKPFDKVLVRDSFTLGTWVCAIYSHYNKEADMHITSGGIAWNFCIPFEGNEDLVGTMNDPKNVEE